MGSPKTRRPRCRRGHWQAAVAVAFWQASPSGLREKEGLRRRDDWTIGKATTDAFMGLLRRPHLRTHLWPASHSASPMERTRHLRRMHRLVYGQALPCSILIWNVKCACSVVEEGEPARAARAAARDGIDGEPCGIRFEPRMGVGRINGSRSGCFKVAACT